MNILIADDEKLMREDLKNAIERVRPGNDYYMAKNYDEAVKVVEAESIDIAFLDINMPGKTGLELTKTLKKMNPDINIIMVTAHADYALSAHRLFVSGYLMKPVMDDELTEALDNLRVPLKGDDKPVRVTCFGNFEIYKNGEDKIISFSRQKEKELLAYLICLKGASANRAEICANIFEDAETGKSYEHLKKIVQQLKKDLDRHGISELLIHGHNSYAINPEMIECDYYDYISGKEEYADTYRGEFLNQYSWAEVYIYALENY